MRFLHLLATSMAPAAAAAKSVFAHFMVGNTVSFTQDDWTQQINLAKGAGIDAFALNMASQDTTNDQALPLAFAAAESVGFKLFFSFDYAGNGPWDRDIVTNLINRWKTSGAYYYRGSQPFVSTFEGPGNADDWKTIKAATSCFFIPDWSSLGAQAAVAQGGGVADGLFSWAAWQNGPRNSDTYQDASYLDFLKGKPYMAPVSPWFYTNLPRYNKNWLWRGDSLWVDRWLQLIAGEFQPEFLQIISWNDYGESHYIGPLDSRQYSAFTTGRAPYNYVENMPHDGWRTLLPFLISMYKTGTASISQEGLVSWYRLNPASACNDGETTGNTASQLQYEWAPADIIQDKIFFAAVLQSFALVSVTIGGVAVSATWDSTPDNGIGMYTGSAATGGRTGPVIVTAGRNGAQIAQISGQSITTDCVGGYNNYNAWVGSNWGPGIAAKSPAKNVADLKCVNGFGVYGFAGLCDFTCKRGYCPEFACTCTALGAAPIVTPVTKPVGYPLEGFSHAYEGLCAYACQRDYCPSTSCSYVQKPLSDPAFSPFNAPACTAGTGPSAISGLCSYSCNWGFCPRHACTCTATGVLHVPVSPNPKLTGIAIGDYAGQDFGLCDFACSRDTYCPDPCQETNSSSGFNPYWIEDACRNVYVGANKVQAYRKMIHAVSDAALLAETAVEEWWDGGEHGEVAAQYLAIPNDGNYKNNADAQTVYANLLEVSKLDSRIPFLSKYVGVHCTDISNQCSQRLEGTNKLIAGYAVNGGNVVTGYTYDVAFCEPWFNTQTLDDAWKAWKDSPKDDISMDYLENDAGKMLHEMMHINMITQERPHIQDLRWNGARVYTAPTVSDWVASGAKTVDVINNADSYTQFVNAIHFKNLFGYLPPPRRPVPITEKLECFGTDNEYVDSAQDKHITDFCYQIASEYTPGSIGEIAREYDAGTPDHIRLRFYRQLGGKLGPNAVSDMCLSTMPKLFHGCDTSSKWKHGGAYTFTQGGEDIYTFYVEPRHERPFPIPESPFGKCDVWYKFFYDEFYLYGGLFAGSDFGQSALLPNLRRCGVVSEWRFDYRVEPSDDGTEWEAYGRLPIGSQMWDCVRSAMVDSGGPSNIGCGGS